MKVISKGHKYRLDYLDGDPDSRDEGEAYGVLQFVKWDAPSEEMNHPGTQTQEVLRALIDRTAYCDGCHPWVGNRAIIYHLRMALVLHEARALVRKVQEGALRIEDVHVDADGHFMLVERTPGDAESVAPPDPGSDAREVEPGQEYV